MAGSDPAMEFPDPADPADKNRALTMTHRSIPIALALTAALALSCSSTQQGTDVAAGSPTTPAASILAGDPNWKAVHSDLVEGSTVDIVAGDATIQASGFDVLDGFVGPDQRSHNVHLRLHVTSAVYQAQTSSDLTTNQLPVDSKAAGFPLVAGTDLEVFEPTGFSSHPSMFSDLSAQVPLTVILRYHSPKVLTGYPSPWSVADVLTFDASKAVQMHSTTASAQQASVKQMITQLQPGGKSDLDVIVDLQREVETVRAKGPRGAYLTKLLGPDSADAKVDPNAGWYQKSAKDRSLDPRDLPAAENQRRAPRPLLISTTGTGVGKKAIMIRTETGVLYAGTLEPLQEAMVYPAPGETWTASVGDFAPATKALVANEEIKSVTKAADWSSGYATQVVVTDSGVTVRTVTQDEFNRLLASASVTQHPGAG